MTLFCDPKLSLLTLGKLIDKRFTTSVLVVNLLCFPCPGKGWHGGTFSVFKMLIDLFVPVHTDDNIDETYGVNVQFESDEEVSIRSDVQLFSVRYTIFMV